MSYFAFKSHATPLRRAITTSALTTLAMLGASAAQAQSALPTGGVTASGAATISGSAGSVTVNQSSNRAIINWTSFDVGTGNKVVFVQPDAKSATLNRVTGANSSTIAGQIIANGAVYLINPNGIAITATGSVQTCGGFIASTLDITDADFNAGTLAFAGTGASKGVSNAGVITAGAGGYVALLGGSVSNAGSISVPLGKVGLGAGETITLDLNGDGFMQVAAPNTLAAGAGASGDRVTLQFAAVRDAIRGVVNVPGAYGAQSAISSDGAVVLVGGAVASAPTAGNTIAMAGSIVANGGRVEVKSAGDIALTGSVNVDSARANGGAIVLVADGAATVSGTLSARATGAVGDGGSIETSGHAVDFTGLKVDTTAAHGATGTWLVDPTDLTVDDAAAATISSNLSTSNVTLQTNSDGSTSGPGNTSPGNGDININSAISWSSANTLTLTAYNNINLNAAITGTNGGLTLSTGNAVANAGAVSAAGAVNVGVFNLTNGAWSQLTASLPAFSATDFRFTAANASFLRATGGTGASGAPYTITDVYGLQGIGSAILLAQSFLLSNDINASGTSAWNGGLGFTPIGNVSTPFAGVFDGGGHVINGLTINQPSGSYIGLFGYVGAGGTAGTLRNVGIVGGSITGSFNVGALAGRIDNGAVSNVFATSPVTGYSSGVGGLVGAQNAGTMTNVYATGAVSDRTSGASNVGGLVGIAYGDYSNVYATGSVTTNGIQYTGGLIGYLGSGSLTNAYATGVVKGTSNYTGGLLGYGNATVSNVYATGAVTSMAQFIGGLMGFARGSLSNAYATGAVSGAGYVGGLVGRTGIAIDSAYATGSVTSTGQFAGGLVGNSGGTISNAYATGAVSGTTSVGGLAGFGASFNNAYWDSYSTGQSQASGSASNVAGATAVTSNPTQSGAANYAYKASAYANLPLASGIGTATPSGFVFLAGNSTRPFLAFEVPTSALLNTDTNGRLVLTNSHQLQLIDYDATRLAGSYSLGATIDLTQTGAVVTGTPGSYAGMWSASGFIPLGTDGAGNIWNGTSFVPLGSITSGIYGFTGTLVGTGYSLTNLNIKRSNIANVGLFGLSSGALSNLTVSGTVAGLSGVGGLAGMVHGGSVTGSTSAVNVTGAATLVGGLVGNLNSGGSVSSSSSSGTITGTNDVGGLVGYAAASTISGSSSSATVNGSKYVGGLIGYQTNSTTSTSSASGNVTGDPITSGGLVGALDGGAVVSGSSTGKVNGSSGAGPLIGRTNGAVS